MKIKLSGLGLAIVRREQPQLISGDAKNALRLETVPFCRLKVHTQLLVIELEIN